MSGISFDGRGYIAGVTGDDMSRIGLVSMAMESHFPQHSSLQK